MMRPGRVKSIVEMTEQDWHVSSGQVVELFRLPDEDQDPHCVECSDDDRKDQRVLGMHIVRDMESDEPGEWDEGSICDPKNGTGLRLQNVV